MSDIHAAGNLLKIERYHGDVCVTFTATADPTNSVEVRFPAAYEAGLPDRLRELADQLAGRQPKEENK